MYLINDKRYRRCAQYCEYQGAGGYRLDGTQRLFVVLDLTIDLVALDGFEDLRGGLVEGFLLLGVFEDLLRNRVEARGEVDGLNFEKLGSSLVE